MDIIAQLIALVFGLTLHEFAHGLMAHYLGDRTAADEGRLTLNPFAHIDPFATLLLPLALLLAHLPVFAAAKPVPFNPYRVRYGRWGAALVALAGPATNFLIAIFFAAWSHLFVLNSVSATVIGAMVIVNVALGVFNLIPFPPLDGSRLLYAVAPEGLRELMDSIERMGFIVILLFMLVGYQYIAPAVANVTMFIVTLLLSNGAYLP